jgi:hypothetical protein
MGLSIGYLENIESNLICVPLWDHRSKHPRQYPPLVIKCAKCQARLTFQRALLPSIDSCGFESCSLQCAACGVVFVGIIDPYDEALLLSERVCDGQAAVRVAKDVCCRIPIPDSQMIGTR